MKRKEVWITRDCKDHPDSDRMYLHILKPCLDKDGQWNSSFDTEATAIPDVSYSQIKRLRIPVHEEIVG